MTIDCLKRHFPNDWNLRLARLKREGWKVCRWCGGIVWPQFMDAHSAGCPKE